MDNFVAATLIAGLGTDMTVFHGPHQVLSWAGVCPGNYESAGKRQGGRTRQGNVHPKTALVLAAVCAAKCRGTYLKDKYHRLRAQLPLWIPWIRIARVPYCHRRGGLTGRARVIPAAMTRKRTGAILRYRQRHAG